MVAILNFPYLQIVKTSKLFFKQIPSILKHLLRHFICVFNLS